ncbi:MAG: hypothetical protein Q7S31_00905 [bacterium]|nr:hypothetical protein [bacterium]
MEKQLGLSKSEWALLIGMNTLFLLGAYLCEYQVQSNIPNYLWLVKTLGSGIAGFAKDHGGDLFVPLAAAVSTGLGIALASTTMEREKSEMQVVSGMMLIGLVVGGAYTVLELIDMFAPVDAVKCADPLQICKGDLGDVLSFNSTPLALGALALKNRLAEIKLKQ